MNKKELIERMEGLKNIFGNECEYVKIDFVIELASELDEPQKVVVPQFVADWYEEHKDNLEFNIFDYVYQFDQNAGFDFKDWFDDFNTKPIQTLVNMHQFGYEVEEEKRYIVSLKNGQPLVKAPLGGNFYFNQNITAGNCKATRKQLEEAGFGWVFDCEGVEVEEVE
jgi:hypothetical protein